VSAAVLFPLHYYHQKHPVNLILLAIFTVSISFAVGMTCAFTSGNNAATVSLNYYMVQLIEHMNLWGTSLIATNRLNRC
jgi:putative component of membrane protein insertase Oxa1/YidC/SpoIIIJ protein YidD